MQLQPYQIYHIFNRGNNDERIFFAERNYGYFLQKVQKYLSPVCDILCYCLMPNHFHLMIYTNEKSVSIKEISTGLPMNQVGYGLKMLLSSYTKAINKQEKRRGSLFKQNTRGVQVNDDSIFEDYALWCFYYIHQNPVKAGLVERASDWLHSSCRAYQDFEKHGICNKNLAEELLLLSAKPWLFEEEVTIPKKIEEKLLI